MIRFKDYRQQYRLNLQLAAPVVISNIGQVVVQLADTIMVGRLGTLPLAAASFGGTVFFTVFIFCIGLTMGLTPLVGEMYAKGSHRTAADYLQNSILIYFVLGVLSLGLLYAVVPLMFHMGQPQDVVDMSIPYYKYLAWSILPFMLYAAFKQFLEGIGNTKVVMTVVIISNLVNIFFNYLLIYGHWGFPAMGAAGAGLATLVSRLCMPVMLVIYFAWHEKFKRYFNFFSIGNFSRSRIRSLLAVGLPIALQMFTEGGAFTLTSIMMGWFGTDAISANQIAIVIANFAFMMVIGVASATTIRISHEYGRGNLKGLKKAANASYHITLLWNAITALTFIALRNYIPMLFTDDPEVIRIASGLMIFLAAFQFSDGLQAITIGILRGMQDVKHIMWVACMSYIVINVPVGYMCAFVLDWGPNGLWIGFIFGLTTASVMLITRFRRYYASLRRLQVSSGRNRDAA